MHTIALPFSDWSMVAPMVAQFGNKMPDNERRASFVTAFDGEKLAGFVHVESLFHFVCEYVAPEYERTGLSMRLISDAVSSIPEGFSGIWLTDRKVDHIATRMGFRFLGNYRVYRKDR